MVEPVDLNVYRKEQERKKYELMFLLGQRDMSRGKSFRDNPYDKEAAPNEREEWNRGWWVEFARQAQTKRQRKMFDESEFSKEALEAFRLRGVEAYKEGKNMGDNPYPVFTAPYKYWEDGWWQTFYKATTIYVENLSAISTEEANSASFTEDKKFGDAKVYDLSFERRMRNKTK